ncbi:MAG: hypothetical protein QGF90_12475 [Gammaproteobacteria bacterium]|nr:hypothetical protein [Gammaproteobacteria bacterium]
MQQASIEPVFQAADLLADVTLGDTQGAGGGAEKLPLLTTSTSSSNPSHRLMVGLPE